MLNQCVFLSLLPNQSLEWDTHIPSVKRQAICFSQMRLPGRCRLLRENPSKVFLCDFLLQRGSGGRISSSMLMNKIHIAPEKPNTTNHLEPSVCGDANVTFILRKENIPKAEWQIFTIHTEKGHLMPRL